MIRRGSCQGTPHFDVLAVERSLKIQTSLPGCGRSNGAPALPPAPKEINFLVIALYTFQTLMWSRILLSTLGPIPFTFKTSSTFRNGLSLR